MNRDDDETLRENKFSLDIDHRVTVDFKGVKELFNLFNNSFQTIIQNQIKIMTDLTAIIAEVEETGTVVDSAIVLIKGLKEKLDAAGTDPVKLKELSDSLDAKNKELAEAVAANTPTEETPE